MDIKPCHSSGGTFYYQHQMEHDESFLEKWGQGVKLRPAGQNHFLSPHISLKGYHCSPYFTDGNMLKSGKLL